MAQKIIVASKNPVKINAAKLGFQDMLQSTRIEVEGVSVPSGVSDQPMDSQETYQGAVNRAVAARKACPDANFWIGIEGGIEKTALGTEVFAWVYLIDEEGNEGKAQTASFYLPPKVIELIDQGMELGEADDVVFKDNNSKQKGGSVGILTNGLIGRTDYYRTAVALALIPIIKKELYPQQVLS